MTFSIDYESGWDVHFRELDESIQKRIWKKIGQLKGLLSARHLKFGVSLFVVEVGQYRICYEEVSNLRTVVFVGNHKQYEKWYSGL